MINVLKKKKCVIYAPANGKVVDLSKVPDPVFSKKMMGEGVGLIFEGDTLFAPLGKLNWLPRLNMRLDLKQIIKQKF